MIDRSLMFVTFLMFFDPICLVITVVLSLAIFDLILFWKQKEIQRKNWDLIFYETSTMFIHIWVVLYIAAFVTVLLEFLLEFLLEKIPL